MKTDAKLAQSGTSNLVAFVVGGGSGIGRACVNAFARAKYDVVVGDINGSAAEAVAKEIQQLGGRAISVALDVSSADDILGAVNCAIEAFGRIDSVVNAAARLKPQPLADCSLDDWDACFAVNVRGALTFGQCCLPHLKKSGNGSIINIGSLSGIFPRPNGGSYGPSKAALVSLSHQMALEWAQYGIRVNIVNPGNIDTPLARAAVSMEVLNERAKRVPLSRIGTPDEVASVVMFLASEGARYVTAQVINCDGGFSQTLMAAPMGMGKAQ
ncbi:4-formylbenzenesulfonate dehydrogenase TsaC1/TsaC2 (plasmid) [Variovorax sp. SRS16]|uniref:SDR family NAD(P)-dependent oxidoreductase n=1 Tax=Variovorax sp. SRS16 TaxID=282217 RepID=UPI001316F81F|nr:SDR family oxidoreductase [Variovorax sp. SRS16]VTU45388.1 4-formylbenzenesulfonate dehydrogenase TsaC1/TsaC2 [Variovorax sp. SRS16]